MRKLFDSKIGGRMRGFTLCICLLFVCSPSFCQDTSQSTYFNWFDKLVRSENSGIYDGIAYEETYRTINDKAKFFKSLDYMNGSVLYASQPYFNLEMKYDVFEDDVLIKLEDRLGGKTIKLFKDKVEKFNIDGHQFVRIENNETLNISGFYEIVLERGQFTLFLKHIKKEFARTDRAFTYHEFIDQKGHTLLEYQGKFHEFETKKEIVTVFPEFKKEINKFYSLARRLEKSDPNEFIKALATRLDNLLSQRKDAAE